MNTFKQPTLEEKLKIILDGNLIIININGVASEMHEIVLCYNKKEKIFIEFLYGNGTMEVYKTWPNINGFVEGQIVPGMTNFWITTWVDWIEPDTSFKYKIDVSKKKCKCNIIDYIQHGCSHIGEV